MTLSYRARRMALCLSSLSILGFVGCRGRGVQASGGSGASLSGPPVFRAQWQTRAPRECAKVTSPPNAAQAAALVQCTMDSESSQGVQLMQDVKVEMGGGRPFLIGSDEMLESIDPSAKVYPIRGSETFYTCIQVDNVMNNKGKNCSYQQWPKSEGRCWRTKFNDWKCSMAAGGGGPQMISGQPGPTTY